MCLAVEKMVSVRITAKGMKTRENSNYLGTGPGHISVFVPPVLTALLKTSDEEKKRYTTVFTNQTDVDLSAELT